MIKSFQHKGLEKFWKTGISSGIAPDHVRKLRLILQRLHASSCVEDMNFPGSNLHALKGDLKGFWSVRVNGNWRIIFSFQDGDAARVDYLDYH